MGKVIIRLSDLRVQKAGDIDWKQVLENDRIQLDIETLTGRFRSHHHDEFDQIFIVESGEGTIYLGGEPFAVGPRDVIVIPAGTEYSGESGEGSLTYWGINVLT